jgi:hypothetical protein
VQIVTFDAAGVLDIAAGAMRVHARRRRVIDIFFRIEGRGIGNTYRRRRAIFFDIDDGEECAQRQAYACKSIAYYMSRQQHTNTHNTHMHTHTHAADTESRSATIARTCSHETAVAVPGNTGPTEDIATRLHA